MARSPRGVDDQVLEGQFNTFLKKLEQVTNHETVENILKMDSKEFIKLFSSSTNLYEGIEHVMQAAYVAAIKTSVKSIAESMISVYNTHNSDIRPIAEDTANDEMIVTS